jgi:tRNA threonylcarbamoyl adenosine modification protein YeaZ
VLLLAFDTATPAVTVALHDGSLVIAEESAVDARRHGELLAVAIEKVLRSAGAAERDLTAIAVGTGPGPYTGLRVGLVTAQVLASALQIPARAVSFIPSFPPRRCRPGTRPRRSSRAWPWRGSRRESHQGGRSRCTCAAPTPGSQDRLRE